MEIVEFLTNFMSLYFFPVFGAVFCIIVIARLVVMTIKNSD